MALRAPIIEQYVERLCRIFKHARNNHEAHREGASVLREMAEDPRCLAAVLEQELRRPGALNTPSFPTIGFDIETNPHFVLVLNSFLPAPTGATDITTNSIHHHGDLLLTTVTTFGPGYEHWRFTPPELIDPENDLFETRLIDRAAHPQKDIAFVDTKVMHAVMFPSSLSITYALWSSKTRARWSSHLKRLSLFRGREEWLREMARRFGLAKALDLKIVSYFDFYPTERGLKGMRERQQFKLGPNCDFLPSLFHIIQQTQNDALVPIVETALDSGDQPNAELIRQLLRELRTGKIIMSKLTENLHFGVPHMNFSAADIERLLGPCVRQSHGAGA